MSTRKALEGRHDCFCCARYVRLGPKRGTWPELIQTMKEVPSSDIASVRRLESRLAGMEAQIVSANSTIAALQQTPTRGLTAAFSGMAASLTRADPVRRTLFPAPANATGTFRPDAERLRMILASPAVIHPRTPAGLAAYNQQIAAYTQKHGARRPSEERPYPLSPGSVAVGSGECHKCGLVGHYSADSECTTTLNLLIPEIEMRWRQIVQFIRTRVARTTPTATAVNIVAEVEDAAEEDVFGKAEYNASVIVETAPDNDTGGGARVPEREEESL
ncbi:hypothetical protein B0H13DRAFT_2309904 [Mycena leptocephala]|nr:hypothetical protein B0H13DRAFT_2309904 [Mycena leptocephala]